MFLQRQRPTITNQQSSNKKKPKVSSIQLLGFLLIGVFAWVEWSLFATVKLEERATTTTTEDTPQRPKPPPPPTLKKTSKLVKKPPPRKYQPEEYANCTILTADDEIYQYDGGWDVAPIVLERHRLLFFTIPKVGCTVFKQLFRRMEGYQDWLDDEHPLPHAPKRNGLQYLYDYPPSVAEHMLTDTSSWTRAIFVRDPKERLLSAYLDKGTQNSYLQFHCCHAKKNKRLYDKLDCQHKPKRPPGPTASQQQSNREDAFLSFSDFVNLIVAAPTHSCEDPHWEPQADRMDAKYWRYINFVGHFESLADDTKRLLQRIQAWDDYGAQGWPSSPSSSQHDGGAGEIFAGGSTAKHATDSAARMQEYYNDDTELETTVQKLFEREYRNMSNIFQTTKR